jgi:predicted outer membrane lipoprotein
MPDPTKPGNRGTYVAIVLACALAVIGVMALSNTERDATTAAPAQTEP